MMKLVYEQSTGRMWQDEFGKRTRLGVGYAGHPPHVNDPKAQSLKAVGPLPRGLYRVRYLGHFVRFGPDVFSLTPEEGTETFGRSGFLIHGDNAYGDRSASHGCIVLDRKVRKQLIAFNGLTLEVIE